MILLFIVSDVVASNQDNIQYRGLQYIGHIYYDFRARLPTVIIMGEIIHVGLIKTKSLLSCTY